MAPPPVMAGVFPKAPPGGRLFRSTAARFFGWAWMVFAAVNLGDLIWRGRDAESLVAAAVLLLASGVAYAVTLRPRIVADERGVRLHNPLRDVHLPWPAVERVEGGDAIRVHAGGTCYRAFVLQTSPRARARLEAKAKADDDRLPVPIAEQVRGRTHSDYVVEQLRELARAGENAPPSRDVSVTWCWPAMTALVLPGVFLIVAVVVAML